MGVCERHANAHFLHDVVRMLPKFNKLGQKICFSLIFLYAIGKRSSQISPQFQIRIKCIQQFSKYKSYVVYGNVSYILDRALSILSVFTYFGKENSSKQSHNGTIEHL